MSREIKFRAWDKKEQIMCCNANHLSPDWFSEHPNLVSMQYTGLEDKNGNEYVDSDIMQWIQENYTSQRLEKVVWNEVGWWIADLLSGGLIMPLTRKEARLRTIIGNIYEHPELKSK